MKNIKKTFDNQKKKSSAKSTVLKLQLNGLQLEITSQNEQYSQNELSALIRSLVVNENTLFGNLAVCTIEDDQSLSGIRKDHLTYKGFPSSFLNMHPKPHRINALRDTKTQY